MENLKIKHFWCNTFIIQNDKVKIAIDPGQNLYLFKLYTLLPKSEWSSITHILVTHGDPDHYWQADRVAEASGAPVICGKDLVKEVGSEMLEGKSIEQALDISDKEIAEALDGLPPSRMHCAELGHELIKSAVDDFIQRKC